MWRAQLSHAQTILTRGAPAGRGNQRAQGSAVREGSAPSRGADGGISAREGVLEGARTHPVKSGRATGRPQPPVRRRNGMPSTIWPARLTTASWRLARRSCRRRSSSVVGSRHRGSAIASCRSARVRPISANMWSSKLASSSTSRQCRQMTISLFTQRATLARRTVLVLGSGIAIGAPSGWKRAVEYR
jgi:hypothetical protein